VLEQLNSVQAADPSITARKLTRLSTGKIANLAANLTELNGDDSVGHYLVASRISQLVSMKC